MGKIGWLPLSLSTIYANVTILRNNVKILSVISALQRGRSGVSLEVAKLQKRSNTMTYRNDFTLPIELLEQIASQGFEVLPELILLPRCPIPSPKQFVSIPPICIPPLQSICEHQRKSESWIMRWLFPAHGVRLQRTCCISLRFESQAMDLLDLARNSPICL